MKAWIQGDVSFRAISEKVYYSSTHYMYFSCTQLWVKVLGCRMHTSYGISMYKNFLVERVICSPLWHICIDSKIVPQKYLSIM